MTNPILAGFAPDPSVCVVDGRYYLANSSFEYFPGIPLHVSDDFANWHPIGHAIDRPSQLDLSRSYDSGGLYAPALRYHDGTFYLACTNFTDDGGSSFYLTATDPAGEWSDPVLVPDARGFDPSLHFDGDRAWWVECREKSRPQHPGDTEIWLRELDLTTKSLTGPEYIIGGGTMVGGVWAEGPHLIARNGWFYLVTAEGGTGFDHAVMVSRSRQLTGPYEPCPRNPIITHRHLGSEYPVRNVGHADLVEGPDGAWRAVLLGSRQVEGRVILGRETFAAAVEWQDDWPVVNAGYGVIRDVESRPAEEHSEPARLGDFVSIRGPQPGAIDDETGVLMTAPCTGVWRRLRHHRAELELRVQPLTPDSSVSLVLRQSDAFQLALRIDADAAYVVERRGGVDVTAGPLEFGRPEGGVLRLRAEVGDSTVRFAVGDLELGELPLDVLDTAVAGGFVGTLFGLTATAGTVRLRGWTYRGR